MKHFNFNECEELISQNRWLEAADLVKSEIKENVDRFQSSNLDDLRNAMAFVRSELLDDKEEQSLFLLNVLRWLRNSSTTTEKQNVIVNNPSLLKEVKNILKKLTDHDDNELLMKVLLQFLVNLVVSNSESSEKVSECLYNNILECFHKRRNDYEALALLYNLHLQNKDLPFEESIYNDVLDLSKGNSCEYVQFMAELFLYNEQFWIHYKNLETSDKIVFLELLKKLWIERKLNDIPQSSLLTLSESFSNSIDVIFQTACCNGESLKAYEVSLLLDVLGSLCGDEKYLKFLEKDKELLIRSGVILINIHKLGKQSENYFSSVQKLSELKEPNEVIQKHPAFGFKVGLVRLIGNLCWRNKKMQDLAREAEVIPVLLDCCNIDARNPLIMQWVILAVRNLCENNLENQAIIKGLHKEGTVSSALIEELGLTLHNDQSGGVRIVPLDIKR